jgi:hypothetical protein
MTAIRKHLSYANAMATLAVFVSLGGGAYAALQIPPHSVGAVQLKRNAVTGAKVRNSSLTGADIRRGSLSGDDIKRHSLTGDDIKPGSLNASQLPRIGLAGLLGASGTAVNSVAIALEAGECSRYVFTANGAQPGDAVILQGSDVLALQHAFEGAPTVSNQNQLNVSVCADAAHAVSQAPGAVQLRFDTLR